MTDEIRISYSMLNMFRNCRRAVKYKYVEGLEGHYRSAALSFGTTIHKGLETWYTCRDIRQTLDTIRPDLPNVDDQLIASCMLEAYVAKYKDNDLEVVSLETTFDAPIYDMATKEPIPGVLMKGIIDGIVKVDGEYYLLEHKTTSRLDESYLEKLWYDFQITLYCYYVNKLFGYKCNGILYNILVKPDFKRNKGETDEEFELRRMEAASKNKSGKTNIKQKKEETDVEFVTRLQEFYSSPYSIHRETLYVSKKQMSVAIEQVAELTHAYLSCVKRNKFYMNTDFCFRYGKCTYWELCKSNENPNTKENLYKVTRTPLEMLDDVYEGPIL
jgi:hypothetical protein